MSPNHNPSHTRNSVDQKDSLVDYIFKTAFAFLLVFACPHSTLNPAPNNLYADRFITKDGGKIEGELLNPNDIPYKVLKIKQTNGVEIEINANYIIRKIADKPVSPLTEYNSFAPFVEDNIENHLKTAEWCRRNNLPDLNKLHLNLALELDPDQPEARKLLGYSKNNDGIWTTPEQKLIDAGLIRTPKGWKTQQQIEVDNIIEERKKTESRWQKEFQTIMHGLPHNPQARNRLLAITDPNAAIPITKALQTEQNPDTRILLIRALSNIGTSPAIQQIARWSVSQVETVSSVKRTCLDELKKHKSYKHILVGLYASQLNPQYGIYAINASALAIAELDGKSAIPQLIEVLTVNVTETQLIKPQGPAFSPSGTGLEWGAPREIKITREVKNNDVLRALQILTGVNFLFDKNAWRNWMIQYSRSQYFNPRRIND
ncbi:MAG: hypothetical protein LBQ66_09885 [Planctomycetaceae bacterium]|jgi:hypothetical protein|nr:hypothetical protein [Planctomycetaceae bacterium]